MTCSSISFKPVRTLVTARRAKIAAVYTGISVLFPVATDMSAAPDPLAIPDGSVVLQGTIAPGWRLQQPLLLFIERDEDGSFIVSDPLFTVYGLGDTRQSAFDDYVVSLIEYYEIMDARAHSDEATAAYRDHLRLYLQPTTK